MTRVLVIHYTKEGRLPKASEEELKKLDDALSKELKRYPDVEYRGTFVNEEGIGICDWKAPDAESIKRILEDSGVAKRAPNNGIIEVKKILPL